MKTSVNQVAAHRSLFDRSRRARRQRGAMAVEFAMVFPLFFVVVYAIVTFSLMMVAQQNLTLAAEEGARAALNWQTNTSVQSALTNRGAAACKAAAAVTASLVSTATCTSTSTACGTNNAMWCVRVLLSYNYLAHPILPAIPFISMTMPKSLNSAATVQINPENLQ
ncbi:TadE/TadG family type IV pilus assembly protein [Paraburkholderia sp. BCC1886]|uniref:TadE/TadG family type IV pilus assembly protein n=1 Tax=Paraburkholderia sp. BCC1886 TaxID=2562670 RepID=UPI00118351B1|nr:TadE family protein [Paraburkholderia sp. BCC1886]